MKTIKQLEEGCGSYNINSASIYSQEGVHSTKIYCGSKDIDFELCKECKAILNQTNEIIKMIKKMKNKRKGREGLLDGDELIKKLRGGK